MPDTAPDPTQTGPRAEPPAGLGRRLAAAVYDAMLIVALLFVATAAILPLTGGRAVEQGSVLYPLYLLYLLAVTFVFSGWFWTHGGQTLGMRAWRVRIRARDGGPVTWRRALIRFCVGVPCWWGLGLGVLWAAFDRDRMSWHDRASGTVLVVTPRRPAPPETAGRGGSVNPPDQPEPEPEKEQGREHGARER